MVVEGTLSQLSASGPSSSLSSALSSIPPFKSSYPVPSFTQATPQQGSSAGYINASIGGSALAGLPCNERALLAIGASGSSVVINLEDVASIWINELDARGVPGDAGCPSVAQYLRGVLKLHPADAGTRAAAAEAAGPRRNPQTGEQLPVPFAHVAAAQATGDISQRSARVIEETIDDLADEVQAEHGEQIEKELVEHATHFDPSQLSRIARRISYCYDQDGLLRDDTSRERKYGLHEYAHA